MEAMKTLKLTERMVDNVNSWGNVEYNIPMRTTQNETRTSTSIGHRQIPNIYESLDCRVSQQLPERVVGRDMVVGLETYRTTSGDYCTKASYNKANERSDNAINCRRTIYMTDVQKRFDKLNMKTTVPLSEFKDKFRGAPNQVTPEPLSVPDPYYIFDAVASGRNEFPCIPETSGGYYRFLDPYYTSYRDYHRPFTVAQQLGVAAKDHITFYTEADIPRVKGFGPKRKEIWQPLKAKVHRGVFDRVLVGKLECKPNMSRNPTGWVPGAFKTETRQKYKPPRPYDVSHGESFDLPPFAPTPWQTNIAPAMYCSEYCHISQGTCTNAVVDQMKVTRRRTPCVERYVVQG